MGKIHQLDTQTANMIAAGEVVERPMGVVKELVENAIDAGSTRITVSVIDGGMTKITVRDNGIGMDSEDALNAFKRHATSKIKGQNDLFDIHTLGFRGEALPSIASVSKVTLTTSDGNDSTRVQIEYGEIKNAGNYPCDEGTEISIEGLFYRTPARLKHLKSGSYENTLIQDVIVKFAFSYPSIAFTFISNDRISFQTTGKGNLLEVIYQAWGREAGENAIAVDFSDYDYHVTGYIVKPSLTRVSRNCMHVFLNGRMVRTFRLYKSILDGYEDFIVKGRNPLVVLNIEMDPQLLDVNVHPSKWEVRISKENQLEYLIKDNIREALKSTILAPVADVKVAVQRVAVEPIVFDTNSALVTPFVAKKEVTVTPVVETKPIETIKEENIKPVIQEEIKEEKIIEEKEIQHEKLPEMTVIGQLHEKFILCSTEKGLAILDQHACQERVHYEELLQKLDETTPVMMELLVPISILAGNDLVERVDEINASISDMHFQFEPFGRDTFIVRSVPMWMKEVEEERFLQDVIDNFKNDRDSKYARMEKKKIATMACHSSIRFNRTLSLDEMKEVVKQLYKCQNPYHCPHGRPTFIILDEKELTKEFLR
ncbi:MAG: DNA mismatch repair endonuclease MutL [Erysipelotrichaceae bacterium]|nr:DNA mismatch repair endonuclease MutL [Erysipelotrichaceae bacterium]